VEPGRLSGAIAIVGTMPDICQAFVIAVPPEVVFDAINSAAGNRAFRFEHRAGHRRTASWPPARSPGPES